MLKTTVLDHSCNGTCKNSCTEENKTSLEILVKEVQVKVTVMNEMEMGDLMVDSCKEKEKLGEFDVDRRKLVQELESECTLRYGIRETPPVVIILAGALQHILLSMSGCLTTSLVVADVACVPFDHYIRSHLFSTTIFMVGLCTIMQTAFGVRLPIFQGPSSSFLVPLLALQRDPKWKCPSRPEFNNYLHNNVTIATNMSTNETAADSLQGIHWRIQEMSGALILASLIEIVMGSSGLLKYLLRFIGPITIACTVTLIGTSLYKLPIIYGRPSFPIAIGCTFLVMVFVLYFKRVEIPLPRIGKKNSKKPRPTFPIFQLLPILLAVVIAWIISWILTVCGVFTDDKADISYMARADAKANIIASSSWFQLTYPGQFGAPKLSFALTLGFLVACFSSMIESVGDYYAAQKVCLAPMIPHHAISRGILVEGIGSILSATVGAGHATTSYSGNIAVLSLTKTGSRVIMYAAGAILLFTSLIGKAGAALTTIPNPILGGVIMVVVSTLLSIGLSNLKHVDMSSSRNILVVGFPLMAGIVVPVCLDTYPTLIQTGNEEANRVINVVLGTPMFLGGVLALILDTTVPGTRESRGMAHWEQIQSSDDSEQDDDIYSWSIYPRIVRYCPILRYIPFLPRVTSGFNV